MTKKSAKIERPAKTRTYGPVSDLERHLPSDWWRTLFNALYLQTDGDVVENDANTAREIDLLIGAAGLEPNDHVLDLCCGQGRHAIELARRGFAHVTGIDRSRYLVRLARKRAKTKGVDVAFHEGDARKFRVAESTFHCVTLMGNSFGYFASEEDDLAVLKAVKRALVSGGTLVMDLADGAWMRERFERRSWEWIDANYFVCRERSLASDRRRLVSREVVVHAERGVIADQFYAERLYTRDEIAALMAEAGFTNLRFHGAPETASDRGQDLGMMARRLFLTAAAPRKRVAAPKRGPVFPEVTLLMGDPRLPDTIKRDGQFNAEDFDTIARLEDALAELPGYRFRTLNNHGSLIADLRANPPQFVFNLCDEGFNNDAFLELHVPALLEMLRIPYTGAGPACLAFCYDKALVRAVGIALDIPVPLETFIDSDDQSATIPSVFPAIIKPNQGDSSIGITEQAVVCTPEQAVTYLAKVREELPGRSFLVQEFLTGPEYSVALVGNPGLGLRALPVLEVDYTGLDPTLPRILGYESKWLPDSPYWTQLKYRQAVIEDDTRRRLVDYSNQLFERLGCRDYARFDFRADAEGEVKLLEVNPNPGWCWDGKFNLMASFAGLRYADLLRMILEAAQDRVAAKGPEQSVPVMVSAAAE
ncbi:MAG: methyltransferase domain-containing protein [Alphaproteobacteria bacterium]|nr:methyltransferase domain-containing protein [Alphaproteobacteria bacterium]